MPEACLEFRLLLAFAEPDGDAAELGVSSRRDDDTLAVAGAHDRAHERTRGKVGQAGAGRHRLDRLLRWQRFAGQHGFVAFQAVRNHESKVSGDDCAHREQDPIAGHQCGHVHGLRAPVPADHNLVANLGVQRGRGQLGPVLVHEAEPHRHRQDRRDDHCVGTVPHPERHPGGDHQQQQQRAAQLALQHGPRPGAIGANRIRSPEQLSPRDLYRRQAFIANVQSVEHGRHRQRAGLDRVQHERSVIDSNCRGHPGIIHRAHRSSGPTLYGGASRDRLGPRRIAPRPRGDRARPVDAGRRAGTGGAPAVGWLGPQRLARTLSALLASTPGPGSTRSFLTTPSSMIAA